MQFPLIKAFAFATLVGAALSFDEPTWADVARNLNLDPEGTVRVEDGKVLSIAGDGSIMDSADLSEAQYADAMKVEENEKRDIAPREEDDMTVVENILRQAPSMCPPIRCYKQSDCTVLIDCYLCRDPLWTCY